MKFARLIERGNRQVLMTVGMDAEDATYNVMFETHYAGLSIVSITMSGFESFAAAQEGMAKMSDNEVLQFTSNFIDQLSEDNPDEQ